jgi:hypothetical protein
MTIKKYDFRFKWFSDKSRTFRVTLRFDEMHIQDSDFDLDLISELAGAMGVDEPIPRDAYQVRRMIERRVELKRLRDLLGDPEFNDLE